MTCKGESRNLKRNCKRQSPRLSIGSNLNGIAAQTLKKIEQLNLAEVTMNLREQIESIKRDAESLNKAASQLSPLDVETLLISEDLLQVRLQNAADALTLAIETVDMLFAE